MELNERLRLWFASLNPSAFTLAVDRGKEEANLKDPVINIVLSILPFAIIVLGLYSLLMLLGYSDIGNISTAVVYIGISFVVGPIVFLAGQGIYWISARIFGGTGGFVHQSYSMSFPYAALSLIFSTIGLFLVLIPFLEDVSNMIFTVYASYMQYLAFKSIHKLSTFRAIGALLAPVIFMFVVLIAIATVIGVPEMTRIVESGSLLQ